MKKHSLSYIALVLIAAVCVLALTSCGNADIPRQENTTETAAPTPTQAVYTEAPDDPAVTPPAPDTTAAPVCTPEPAQTASPEPEPLPPAGPDLTAQEKIDDSFFNDAAFFGNSLVDGLHLFGGLEYGSFYAATSASVVNVEITHNVERSGGNLTLFQALTEEAHGKIYILLGINEIGFEPDYFIELYSALLERIRQLEPEADIYIMSLTPVTQACSEKSSVFNMDRIKVYNEALHALAEKCGYYYLDLCEALAGEDGFLPQEDSTDGIHLKQSKYLQWADYLRTHYADTAA